MKRLLVLSLVLATGFSTQAFGQDLYRAAECGNFYKNPDADASPDMRQKINATFPSRGTARGMIVNIGINNALIDMMRHRAHQCERRSAGKAFEALCPFGKTIFVDDYVNDALKQFANQSNGALQSIMEQGHKAAKIDADAMKSACK